MGRAARKIGLPRLAGAGSGVHRLKDDKPHAFKPEEERKCGGPIACGKSARLGRKRGGSIKSALDGRNITDGPGAIGTDDTPDRGAKFGTKLQRKDGGQVKWIQGAIKHPGAETNAAKKAGMSTHAFMEKHKDDSGKSGARARLGLRLSAMAKHKKD